MNEQCTVVVCRGCCCGTESKHPDLDHAAQLSRLRDQAGHRVRVRVSDCLGRCERSNVVIVLPGRQARRSGARPVWFGWILDVQAADAIAAWTRAGGPGRGALPALLELHRLGLPARANREPR
jgi:(2Fe-2S) ferredoxin